MPRAASRSAPRLDIRLLGPPEVHVDGRPLAVDTRKAVAILAILAVDGRTYARDELAALLWPDSDDVAARGALRRTLSTLRSALGNEPLRIDRSRVELDRSQVRLDLARVDAAIAAGDRVALADAAAQVRGTFLAGFNLRDSPEFDDWRAARAVVVERAVVTLLDRLSVAAETDGDLAAAIEAASRRLDLDPLDEAAHVRLMGLLAIAGDRGGALRQYRSCVAILERELGVAPLASTTARYEAIRDAAAEPALVPSSTVRGAGPVVGEIATAAGPASLPLVGRDAATAAIMDVYRGTVDGAGRLAAIVGEAGIGKTRLADEIAARVRTAGGAVLAATAYPAERSIAYAAIVDLLRGALESPNGAVRLGQLEPRTRVELARLLPAIDPHGTATPPPGGAGAHARLVAAIAEGLASLVGGPATGAIVIDDVQWLDAATLEAIEFLGRRLAGRPVLLVLTWRPEDLDADGRAATERLTALAGASTVTLERLGRGDVAALVAAARGGVEAEAADLVERLMVASEGLPLYVTEVLAAGRGAAPETLPSGVRAVLRGRLVALSEMAGQVLAAGAVIGRSFDQATVRYASGRSDDETVDALDEGLRHGLIRETAAGFDFVHGALRDLVYEATSLTRRRLLHRRVAEALRLDVPGSGRDDLGRLVLVAVHERAAGRDAEAAEAYRAAGQRAAEVFANREAIEQLEAALALGHPDGATLHVTIGRLRTRLGDYSGAVRALESAAATADPGHLPLIEWSLARAHLRHGDLAAASHHIDAAAAGAAAAGDDRTLAAVLVDRSALDRRRGDVDGAAAAAGEALAVAERTGDPAAEGAAHRMTGLVALDLGDAPRAAIELRLAVEAAQDDPDPTASIAALIALAMATAAAGQVDASLIHGEAAASLCRRIGDRHLEAAVEDHLADILHAAGRDDDARPHQLRAVAAFAEVGGDPADPDPGIWMLSAS